MGSTGGAGSGPGGDAGTGPGRFERLARRLKPVMAGMAAHPDGPGPGSPDPSIPDAPNPKP